MAEGVLDDTTGWVVIPLRGDADLAAAPALRRQLAQVASVPAWVVLDLSGLDFIDSTGLGVLVGMLRRVRAGGGDVRIAGARPGIERVFSVTGLDQLFSLYPTVEAAIEHRVGS